MCPKCNDNIYIVGEYNSKINGVHIICCDCHLIHNNPEKDFFKYHEEAANIYVAKHGGTVVFVLEYASEGDYYVIQELKEIHVIKHKNDRLARLFFKDRKAAEQYLENQFGPNMESVR